jgi:hypothetical protein
LPTWGGGGLIEAGPPQDRTDGGDPWIVTQLEQGPLALTSLPQRWKHSLCSDHHGEEFEHRESLAALAYALLPEGDRALAASLDRRGGNCEQRGQQDQQQRRRAPIQEGLERQPRARKDGILHMEQPHPGHRAGEHARSGNICQCQRNYQVDVVAFKGPAEASEPDGATPGG